MISPVIKFVTYNVGGRDPPQDTSFLKGLLNLEESNPDIISFGTEEQPANFTDKVHDIVDEQAGNKTGDKKGSWGEILDEALSPKGYYLIAKNNIYYTHLRVYTKKQHMGYISHVETIDMASGFVGGVSNVWKGAITTRFMFYGTSFAFINAHLSAHQEQTLNRNTEYWDNMKGQEFRDPTTPNIYDHDYIFWSGDLNYRINADNELVRKLSVAGDISSLIPHDQLLTQQKRGLAFLGFEEADIKFIPTYKFNFDTNVFDTKKNRIPAWCDRVLVRVKEHRQIAAGLINWGDLELSDESSLSFSSDDIDEQRDCKGKKKTKKKVRKSRKGICTEQLADDERVSGMRSKALGLLLRTDKSCSLKTTPQKGKIEFDKNCFTDQALFEELINKVESTTREIISGNAEYQTVDILEYKGHPTLLFSDHKPVSCTMRIRLKENPIKPTLRFEFDEYTWPKNEKLTVHIKDAKSLKRGRFKIFRSNWIDYYDNKVGDDKTTLLYDKKLKHLNPCRITEGQVLTVDIPASVHPGAGEKVSMVFVTGHNEYMATAQIKCT